jgi:hypothetical protein
MVAMYRLAIASTACRYEAMVKTAEQVHSDRFFMIAVSCVALNGALELVAKMYGPLLTCVLPSWLVWWDRASAKGRTKAK